MWRVSRWKWNQVSETFAAMFIFFLSYLFTGSMPGARNSFEIREFFTGIEYIVHKLDGWEEIASNVLYSSKAVSILAVAFSTQTSIFTPAIFVWPRTFSVAILETTWAAKYQVAIANNKFSPTIERRIYLFFESTYLKPYQKSKEIPPIYGYWFETWDYKKKKKMQN